MEVEADPYEITTEDLEAMEKMTRDRIYVNYSDGGAELLQIPLSNVLICKARGMDRVYRVRDINRDQHILMDYTPSRSIYVEVETWNPCQQYALHVFGCHPRRVYLAQVDINRLCKVLTAMYPDQGVFTDDNVMIDNEKKEIFCRGTVFKIWYTKHGKGDSNDVMFLNMPPDYMTCELFKPDSCDRCGAPRRWYCSICRGYVKNSMANNGVFTQTNTNCDEPYRVVEDPNAVVKIPAYRRKDHINEFILALRGIENTIIPSELVDAITRHELMFGRNAADITREGLAFVLQILAESHPPFAVYRRSLTKLLYRLTGRNENPFNAPYGDGDVNEVKEFFKECENAFDKIPRPERNGRKNMLQIATIMAVCFYLKGWRGAEFFPLVDATDRRVEQNRLLVAIGTQLGWARIPQISLHADTLTDLCAPAPPGPPAP
jgi:hypothetical protein